MKKRDILILVGLGVVVVIAAYYFLLLKPKMDDLSTASGNVDQTKQQIDDNNKAIQRLPQEQALARQNTADLLKLNKLVPADDQVASLIVELQETANESGVDFMSIKPSTPEAGTGINAGATVIPIELKVEGGFYDIDDFLYRVENYARMQGSDVTVSGRLLNVVDFKMAEPDVTGVKFPSQGNPNGHVQVTMTADAYMTSPPPATKPAGSSTTSSSSSSSSSSGSSGGAEANP